MKAKQPELCNKCKEANRDPRGLVHHLCGNEYAAPAGEAAETMTRRCFECFRKSVSLLGCQTRWWWVAAMVSGVTGRIDAHYSCRAIPDFTLDDRLHTILRQSGVGRGAGRVRRCCKEDRCNRCCRCCRCNRAGRRHHGRRLSQGGTQGVLCLQWQALQRRQAMPSDWTAGALCACQVHARECAEVL